MLSTLSSNLGEINQMKAITKKIIVIGIIVLFIISIAAGVFGGHL